MCRVTPKALQKSAPKKWQEGQINSKHVATCSLKLPSLRFVHPLFSTRVSELLVYFRTIFQRKNQIFTQFFPTSFTVFHPGLSRIVQICLDIFRCSIFSSPFSSPEKNKWLVVWNMLDLFPYIGNVVIPTEGLKPPTRFHIPSFPTYSHRYSHRYSHSYPYMFHMFPKKKRRNRHGPALFAGRHGRHAIAGIARGLCGAAGWPLEDLPRSVTWGAEMALVKNQWCWWILMDAHGC